MHTVTRTAVILACAGILWSIVCVVTAEPIAGGTLDPLSIPKYESPLIVPPVMPQSAPPATGMGKGKGRPQAGFDYYQIAVRQFEQAILPPSMGLSTTVWGYGSVDYPGTVAEGGTFMYPSFTIEAQWNRPVRVKWINDLVDAQGNPLPHLFAVDQTLHWANPMGPRDHHGMSPEPYVGPVPMVPHLHGAHVDEESDGYPEAWWLPAGAQMPYNTGTFYDLNKPKAEAKYGQTWEPGTAVYQYTNDQRATTLWYHDHTLGMTRLNVYAGPTGFYLIRGGPDDKAKGTLPEGAYEIPLVIQDRSFNEDGGLFFPDNRAFFEGLEPEQLQIPFHPDMACTGVSDIAPMWNPEFFGNTMVVNGQTWPYLEVEPRRYRLRLLNGCNSRFLILQMDNAMPFWQIGSDGGFLPSPVQLETLLIGPAERADILVDFGALPVGTTITLLNLGPDEPFGGGEPGEDFDPADEDTTGQVMQFKVIAAKGKDKSVAPTQLRLPPIAQLPLIHNFRIVTLNELDSETVSASEDEDGNIVSDCENGEPFGPAQARLGVLDAMGDPVPLAWMDDITENVNLNTVEMWEIQNHTMDAHPIHLHLVMFQVVERMDMDGNVRGPEPWETGWKDTVIAYPGEMTRIKARFDKTGLYVWHCHILDHEDNEMMRPYRVIEPKPRTPWRQMKQMK